GEKLRGIIFANDGHALRRAAAEKGERERHSKILLPNGNTARKFPANNLPMLTTLRIKNLALVADLTLELQAGYNAISGETGAGKSILIGALNLVLGERADRTLIRSGSES